MRQSERIGASASIALHVLALAAFAAHGPMRPAAASQRPMAVTLRPAPAGKPEIALPAASTPAAQPRRHRSPKPPPAPSASLNETPSFAAEPIAPPASSATADAPVVEVAPAFDAEYLRNPAPAYPSLSRRLREHGKVVLRVHVDAAGNPDEVQLRVSSGSERLDASARETVMRWKFSPARRGVQPVPAWVLVPISFSLEG